MNVERDKVKEINKYGSALIFLSDEAQEAWDTQDECVKKHVKYHLEKITSEVESKVAIEMISCVINDMQKEIDELKNKLDI